MKRQFLTTLLMGLFLAIEPSSRAEEPGQRWRPLFNGKDLAGWKTDPKQPGQWHVKDGALVGTGDEVSHLFSERGDFEGFHLRVEAKINATGNSGVYFRSEYGLNLRGSYPLGYEAQIDAGGGGETQLTGSLYGLVPVHERLVQPDKWFTLEVIGDGRSLTIKVDGKTTVEFKDEKNTYRKGHLALQQARGTTIAFRKIEVLEPSPADLPVGTLFVAANGSDHNPGTRSQPFQHIQRGIKAAKPGDVVCVEDGDYHENIMFAKSGTADGWITLRPRNEVDVQTEQPRVRISPRDGAIAILLNGHSYIQIEGLEISGGVGGIVSSGALGHHTVVTNNLVHHTSGSGIQLNNGDYRTITKNIIHDCAKTWKKNGSGISIYTPTALDSEPGFHNVIAQNISYNNSNPPGGTDGNGIIFDDGKHSQHDKLPYAPASLIEDNLVYFNGGAGIQVFQSINVTVRNNIAYWNRQLPNKFTWRGELSNQLSDDVIWVNNIAWANPALDVHNTALFETAGAKGVVWRNNISYNGTPGKASFNHHGAPPDGNLFGVNPLLVNPPSDFRLRPGSPAIRAGTSAYGVPAVDLAGNPRSGPVDIGAYVAGATDAAPHEIKTGRRMS